MSSLLKNKSIIGNELLEDPPELKEKLKNCSQLITDFIKTLNDNQAKKFLEIDVAISNYHASREDFIKSIYEKNL